MHNPFGHHQPEPQQPYQAPHGVVGSSHGDYTPRGEPSSFFPQANVYTFKIHCEANPEFFLAARGDVAVLAPENPRDPQQQEWIKIDSWGLRVKDGAGFPAFALVNKATRHALIHGDKEWDQINLAHYNHDKAEQSVLWTLSADVGNGYQCLRPVNNINLNMLAKPVNNINLNMVAKAADGHVGGIRDGNELILFEWKNQSNQKWKLQPVHDKGAVRPADIPIPKRRRVVRVAAEPIVPVIGLQEVVKNLQGLTISIPPLKKGEVPLHMQRHTVGVPNNINSLLRRVARAVICYSQHNVVWED